MKIYILRHGETFANQKGALQGSSNTELTDFGKELALEVGEALKDYKFDAVFSSPLNRAYETAKLILSKNNFNLNLEIKTDKRLEEINLGVWEGKNFKDPCCGVNKEDIKMFFTDPFKLQNNYHGESALDVCKRTQAFLKDLSKLNYKNVLITTHGFAMRAMLNFLYDNKLDFWQGGVPYNLACNIIEYKDGKFSFISKDKIFYDKEKCTNRYKL